jgi:hypothetical protein
MEAYEIRVKGHLSGKTLGLFADLTATLLPTGETLLTGVVPDQAALHGILQRIHSLGMVLVQVQPVHCNTWKASE